LTPAERLAKRRLVIQDTLGLVSVLAVTCILAVLTWLIFRSYSQHQSDAAARWKRRGQEALAQGKAAAAVYDLRTSMGYGLEDTGTRLELATALAEVNTPRSLGEAAVYLNTLWEKEPGNGNINLQLARVLAKQKQTASALDHYHAAVYGVWQGHGAVLGRQARLEMVRYQIALGRYNDARGELLIAAGNDSSTETLMEVAGLLTEAHAPADALHIYQEVARRRPLVVPALEGAGQIAFTLGRYRTARDYLEKALGAANAAHPLGDKASAEKNLRAANQVIAIYPSPALPQRERLRRVVQASETARKRYTACANGNAGENPVQNGKTQIQNNQEMTALGNRWKAAQPRLTIAALANDAKLEAATMQLVYDTEQVTAHMCGEPGGDDAALLRIAASPESVNQ
jgi:tetratricopeptide (TPR) repeat protein